MSKAVEARFDISFKHLTTDGKGAAADLPAAQLNDVSTKQFRRIIEAVAAIAPRVVYPVEPELRITAMAARFVVQVRAGKLHLVSWSAHHKGGEYPADRIYAIITGEEVIESRQPQAVAGGSDGSRGKVVIALLIVAIVAVNAFTIWFVSRPKRTLLPKYTLLAAQPAGRLLSKVTGAYETGGTSGDRRLEISKEGQVRRYKFGPERALKDQQTFTVQAADAGGKPALLTSRQALITVKDPLTVVLYGDSYRRVPH